MDSVLGSDEAAHSCIATYLAENLFLRRRRLSTEVQHVLGWKAATSLL